MSLNTLAKAQPATAVYSDPAQQYNRITRDKFENSYTLIGAYKVTGNPYLYGGSNEGVVYLKGEGMKKGKITYNTYSQQVEIVQNEGGKPDLRDVNTVDSFSLTIRSAYYNGDLQFINANQWDTKNKFFVQKVVDTAPYQLYKRFYTTLEVVTTNYVQSELRQFELNYEYFYTDSAAKNLLKLKTSENGLKKEFAQKKDCYTNLDFSQLSVDKEAFLKSFFQSVAACK